MEPLSNEQEKVKVEMTDHFPCPTCGGNMVFDPASQKLNCPYCGNKTDIEKEQNDIKEYDFESAEKMASTNWEEEKRIIRCESCGAQTILNKNDAAKFCAFCGSSHILKLDESPGIVPESLVPFKITKDKALNCFKEWISKKFFAPKALKKEYQNQKLSGIYIPCWTYDSDTYSRYSGEAGTYYYVPETEWVTENGERKQVTKQVRKIRWNFVSGDYDEFYNDVLINASKQINEGLMHKLEPFNLQDLVKYKPQFLSGFLAERYSVGLQEGWDKVRNLLKDRIKSSIINKINADEVRNLSIDTSYNNIKYKHLLLPIWISAYTYNKKIYRYMINGQTAEVQGESPVSILKVILTIIVVLAIIGILLYFFG